MLRKFVIIPVLVIFVALLIMQLLIQRHTNQLVEDFQLKAVNSLKNEKSFFLHNIEEVRSDLLFLAKQTQSMLAEGTDLGKVAQIYRQFSHFKKHYDQVRFLDKSGQEVIRVNYHKDKPQIIASKQLQNKSHRYYFTETIGLKSGEIYVSPFDLNIENKEVEVPLKPMIRFATPIVKHSSIKNTTLNLENPQKSPAMESQGIIILNYFGQKILDQFIDLRRDFFGSIMLLNADGYYLIGRKRDQEWSFMFKDKAYGHFKSDYPEIWSRMEREQKAFSFSQNEQGLFFYSRLNSQLLLTPEQKEPCKNCNFILVAHLSAQQLQQVRGLYLADLLPYALFLTVMVIIVLWLALNYYDKHRQVEQKLQQIHKSIIAERDAFIGGPTVVIKWSNHFAWPVEYVSANIRQILGYSAERFKNQELNLSAIIVPEHRQQVIDNLKDAQQQDKDWVEIDAFQFVTYNGERRWTQGTVSLLKNDEQVTTGYFGYFNDISILKETEAQLIRSKKYIQTVINTIPDPTLVIDVDDYKIRLSNQAANRVYLSNEYNDISAMTCYNMTHKTARPCKGKDEPCPLQEVQKSGLTVSVLHTHYNKNGEEIYVEVVATPIFDQDKKVTQIIESHRDVTGHIKKEKQLQKLATTDTLTQVCNRLKFDQELSEHIEMAHRSADLLGLIMLDIDHFKQINDQYGHDVGDDILKKFVAVVRKNIRKQDLLARWGGEEFMLLIPDCDKNSIMRICEHLRQAIATFDFEIGCAITASFGITCLLPQDNIETMSKRVDQALYESKQAGRNRCTFL